MAQHKITIINEAGIHARPASLLVKKAEVFKSEIKLIKGEKFYNAKSIIGILSMAGRKGDEIILEAVGEDEEEALEALMKLFNNGFGE